MFRYFFIKVFCSSKRETILFILKYQHINWRQTIKIIMKITKVKKIYPNIKTPLRN